MKRLIAAALWVPLGILSVVLVLGCVQEVEEEPPDQLFGQRAELIPRPDSAHLVTITGDTGTLIFTLDPVRVKRGDTLSWTTTLGDWEVDLGDDGPGRKRRIAGGVGDTVGTIVAITADTGTYKYRAAVRIGNYLVLVDPEIIVENGDG